MNMLVLTTMFLKPSADNVELKCHPEFFQCLKNNKSCLTFLKTNFFLLLETAQGYFIILY